MAGLTIRKKVILFFIIVSCLISCKKGTNLSQEIVDQEIDKVVFEYINYFKQLKKIKKRDFILKVQGDTISNEYLTYRISMRADLLNENEIPNRINIYDKIKIAFFTENITDSLKQKKILLKLKENGFLRNDSILILSNYPEWVLLIHGKTGKRVLEKNMWYEPIDSIIKKHEKELALPRYR